MRYVDTRDGLLSATVPNELDSLLIVRMDGEMKILNLDANSAKTQYLVEL